MLPFLKRPNRDTATKMILSSHLSGKAINISKTTAPHAVSYPFTSLFGINHGHAVALNLEKFLKFNYTNYNKVNCTINLKKRYKILFDIFKVKDISELCNKIKYIKSQANLIDDFKLLNIDINNNIDKILKGVNFLRMKNNPIKLDNRTIKEIILNRPI